MTRTGGDPRFKTFQTSEWPEDADPDQPSQMSIGGWIARLTGWLVLIVACGATGALLVYGVIVLVQLIGNAFGIPQ